VVLVNLVRELSETEAKKLKAGSEHYAAYVGPPGQYDFMGATQFRLLCALGLRDTHLLLDFGCGSLRAGRLMIPYLQPERYFGIEPNAWLVEDAIANQLGQDILRIKRPRFSHSDAFTAAVFTETFDFIVAQSIFSHAGQNLVARALGSFAEQLRPDGICAVTFIEGGRGEVKEGWVYPGCVEYRLETIENLIQGAGLVGMPIPWFHPRQSWFLLARESSSLPSADEVHLLHGAVLRSPDFRSSISGKTAAMKERDREHRRTRRHKAA